MSSPLNFHLEQYDGPLDLLLDLIRKQQIDIKDIPASLSVSVTEGGVGSVDVGKNGSVQSIQGKLTINNTNNFTILTVNDSADNMDRTEGSTAGPVTVSATSIDGLPALRWTEED